MTKTDREYIASLPEALPDRKSLFVDQYRYHAERYQYGRPAMMGHTIKDIAEEPPIRTASERQSLSFSATSQATIRSWPAPFMVWKKRTPCSMSASADPGVIARALERLISSRNSGSGRLRLDELAEEIKQTTFRVTRCGELIGRQVSKSLGIEFGVVDLSLAPTPTIGDSVGEIFKILGVDAIGAPGSTAILAMLNDAVKKGGIFASKTVGGLSGAFIPVMEDALLAEAVGYSALCLEKLEAMTCVCSVGLDMIAIPGSVDADTISAIIADEMALGMINNKTTAVRLIPVPGKEVGDSVSFGGLFGASPIMEVRNVGKSGRFIGWGGRIPAPVHSFKN